MYHGRDTIDWIVNNLQIDDEWMVRRDRGVSWWCGQLAQHIDYEAFNDGFGPAGKFKITIVTDLMNNVDITDDEALYINTISKNASLAAIVYNESQRTLKLHSQLVLHESIHQWMNNCCINVALLQLYEAESLAEGLRENLKGDIAYTQHPTSGYRKELDEIFLVIEKIIIPAGMGLPKWSPMEFDAVLSQYMRQPPALLATGGGRGVTVELSHGGLSSLLEMYADEPHQTYGTGLYVVHKFDYSPNSTTYGYRKALELNTLVLSNTLTYGLGSFYYRDGFLVYTAFFPNVMHIEGLLANLYFTSIGRMRLVDQHTEQPHDSDNHNDNKDAIPLIEMLKSIFKRN
jgi:hypothetical protein